jgi:quercetin dioxygenase-like cupin family protein
VAYVIEGEVTVELEDGSKRVIRAGEAFAEVINLKHNGSNRGKVPAKLVMFAVGTTETPIAVKK